MNEDGARAAAEVAMPYRPEIDGLRGLAVLGVILFHADPRWLPGGYVGVDVFFVISGYLITRIVSAELQVGRFRTRQFFARRIRRLIPALLLVLTTCLLPAWFLLLPRQLSDFSSSILAVSELVANLFFWRQTGYFSAGAEQHPLIHTWSLSVEEQFYLLFAIAFVLCWRHARQKLMATLLITAGLSLLACEVASRTAPAFAFYGLPFRAWELLAGAALGLASASRYRVQAMERWSGYALSGIGLAMIVSAMLAFNAQTPFPSVYALLPVGGTMLIVARHDNVDLIGRLLAWPPLVAIGVVSYSAYLWHQPVFTFARIFSLQPLTVWAQVALVVLTLGLAALSWRWVEQPMRRKSRSTASLAWVVIPGLLLVNGAAWWLLGQEGAPYRLNAQATRLLAYAQERNPQQRECMARTEHPIPPAQGCLLGLTGAEPTIAVLGDSHADALFVALDRTLRDTGLTARFLAQSGCPPVPGVFRTDIGLRSTCDSHQREVRDFLDSNRQITTVIVASRWAAYLDESPFDNGEGGVTGGPKLTVDALTNFSLLPRIGGQRIERRTAVANIFTAGLQSLLAKGRRVVLVYPIPEVGWSVPERLAVMAWRGVSSASDLSTDWLRYVERNRTAIAALDAVRSEASDDAGLLRIHPDRLFCNRTLPSRCLAQHDGKPLYYDDNHLNTIGAGLIVDRMAAALKWKIIPS